MEDFDWSFARQVRMQFALASEFIESFREAYSEFYDSEDDLVRAMEEFDRVEWYIPKINSKSGKEVAKARITRTETRTTPYGTSHGVLYSDINDLVEGGINVIYIHYPHLGQIIRGDHDSKRLSEIAMRKSGIQVKNHISIEKPSLKDQKSVVKEALKYFYGENLKENYRHDLLIVSDYLKKEDTFEDSLLSEFFNNGLGLRKRRLAFSFGAVTDKYLGGGLFKDKYLINKLSIL